MAEYMSPTVVEPPLSLFDLSPAEAMLLDILFATEPAGVALRYCAASRRFRFEGALGAPLVRHAVAASPPGLAVARLTAALAEAGEGAASIPVRVDDLCERLLQDFVRRSATCDHIVIVTAFAASDLSPEKTGGSATVITADHIDSLSTFDFVETVLAERLLSKA
ncbi:MAG: hypothetical protein JWQ16_244 [Novosphingobium sp.]|nr:hypothetical protein [Novosphingobium sp.]